MAVDAGGFVACGGAVGVSAVFGVFFGRGDGVRHGVSDDATLSSGL